MTDLRNAKSRAKDDMTFVPHVLILQKIETESTISPSFGSVVRYPRGDCATEIRQCNMTGIEGMHSGSLTPHSSYRLILDLRTRTHLVEDP